MSMTMMTMTGKVRMTMKTNINLTIDWEQALKWFVITTFIACLILFCAKTFDLNITQDRFEDGSAKVTVTYCVPSQPCMDE